jgi:hypothetical protein
MMVVVELEDLSDASALRASRLRWCGAVIREFHQNGTPSMSFCFDFDGSNHGSGIPFVIEPSEGGCSLRIATVHDGVMTKWERGSDSYNRDRNARINSELRRTTGMRRAVHEFGKHPSMVTSEDLLAGVLSFLVHDVIEG